MRFAERFGWNDREIDRMTVTAANWFADGLNEERAWSGQVEPVDPSCPKSGVITPEEFARIEGQMRAVAATDKRRSPWA